MEDSRFMLYSVDLAMRSDRQNQPNPMVGAVIVWNNQIIGEGYHEKFGEAHAEINALKSVHPDHKPRLPESILYVTLEPCSHHGKTPPCVDAIIQSGIRKVVIGTRDPNPLVEGRGIQKLTEAGIDVYMSGKENEARRLIRPFMAHLKKRPYVVLKCVKSKDCFMGKTGEYIWLSNALAKTVSHDWRSHTDAIVTGKNTVMTDNPELTTRLVSGSNPLRVLIDPNLECGFDKKIFAKPEKVIVFNSLENSTLDNVTRVKIEPGDYFEQKLLETLFSLNIYHLVIEGGAYTLKSFLQKGLWDEARVISTPVCLTSGIQAPDITGKLHSMLPLGDNTLQVIYKDESSAIPH